MTCILIGEFMKFKPLHDRVLIEVLDGSEKTAGGIIIPDTAQEKPQEEHERRISNLAQAYQFAENEAQNTLNSSQQAFIVSELFVLSLHKLISTGIDDERYKPGEYRDNPKGQITRVGDADHGGVYKPPQAHVDIKLLMGKLVEWLNSDEVISLPSLVRAPLAHYYFERIHPFNDGNGRVGRLLEKTLLIASGDKYAGRGIDRYYLTNIDNYFSAFNLSRNNEQNAPETCNYAFVEFVLKGFDETIERMHHRANKLMEHFLILAWLGDLLRDKKINQREHVILDYLDGISEPIKQIEIKRLPWYKELYRRYSPATESRDWQHLFNDNLIIKSESGVVGLNPFKI